MYLIFKEDDFFGYTYDKSDVKGLLKQRKGHNFRYEKVPDDFISKELLNSPELFNRQVTYYEEYKLVLAEQELYDITEILDMRFDNFIAYLDNLRDMLKFIKLSDSEKIVMRAFIDLSDTIRVDLEDDDPSAFVADYFPADDVIQTVIYKE